MLAKLLQVDERFLNKPDEVKKVMQAVQNEHSAMQVANSMGMMPEQPPNPSVQPIVQQ